jgi:predicted DCC family thiol-disulfide oxidoreductase YuxK
LEVEEDRSILLFDGVCNLCNGFVQFTLKRDAKAHFIFASLQSEVGSSLIKKYEIPGDVLQSVILVENGKYYLRSTAVLRLMRGLSLPWPFLYYVFVVIPRPIRDWAYRFVATHRYRWFGRQEQCWLPRPEWKSRFLG